MAGLARRARLLVFSRVFSYQKAFALTTERYFPALTVVGGSGMFVYDHELSKTALCEYQLHMHGKQYFTEFSLLLKSVETSAARI